MILSLWTDDKRILVETKNMQYFKTHDTRASPVHFHYLFDIYSYIFFLPFTVKVNADAKSHEYWILSSLPRKVKTKPYIFLFVFNNVLTIVNKFLSFMFNR